MGDDLKDIFKKVSGYVDNATDYVRNTINDTYQMYKGAVEHVEEHGVDWNRTGQFALKGFYKGIASSVGSMADGGIWVYNNGIQDVVNFTAGTDLEETNFSAKDYLSENIYHMPLGPGAISPSMMGINNYLVAENDYEKGVEATAQIGTEAGIILATSAGISAAAHAGMATLKSSAAVNKLTHGALTHSTHSPSTATKILSGGYEVVDKGYKTTSLLNRAVGNAVTRTAMVGVSAATIENPEDSVMDVSMKSDLPDSAKEELYGSRTAASAYSRDDQFNVLPISPEFSRAAVGDPQQPNPDRPFSPQPEEQDSTYRNFVSLNPGG